MQSIHTVFTPYRYEKLHWWQAALLEYDSDLDRFRANLRATTMRDYTSDPEYNELLLGRMRCLEALAEWDPLATQLEQSWRDCSSGAHIASTSTSWHGPGVCLYTRNVV